MIESRDLQLRTLEKSDLGFLHRLNNDFRAMNYFFEEPFESLRELEDLFEKHIHDNRERRFILTSRKDGEDVGALSLIEVDDINRNCEIEIIIDQKWRGRGFGKAGFCLGVKYGFDILNLFKVYLLLLPENLPARKIYDYIGFREECRLQQEYFVNGEYVDAIRMCLFRNEWCEKKPYLQAELGFG